MKRIALHALASVAALGVLWMTGPAQALTNAEIANLKGPDRSKILLDGAKKEGKVVLYSPISANATMRPMSEVFIKKYPGVKLEFWVGGTVETMQKITAERRAQNQFADLMEGGTGAYAAIEAGLVEPSTSPSLGVYSKEMYHPFGLWAPSRVAYMGMAYNTRAVSAAEMPKTFDEFLDPKWKNKMVWVTSTDAGAPLYIANLVQTRGKEKAEEYLKKLADQNVVPFPENLTNMVNRVGQGEYTIALHAPAHSTLILARQGAPVDVQMMDPIPGLLNTIQLIKGAPHPHAAMLFLDYFLGKEGQTLMSETGYMAVHPEVDPSPHLQKVVPRLAKMKEYVVTPEQLNDTSALTRGLFKKYFD